MRHNVALTSKKNITLPAHIASEVKITAMMTMRMNIMTIHNLISQKTFSFSTFFIPRLVQS